jgi:hypothetical protein
VYASVEVKCGGRWIEVGGRRHVRKVLKASMLVKNESFSGFYEYFTEEEFFHHQQHISRLKVSEFI